MEDQKPWFLRYSCPVLFPAHEALAKPRADFEAFVLREIKNRHGNAIEFSDITMDEGGEAEDTATWVTDTTTADIRQGLREMGMDAKPATEEDVTDRPKVETENTFMDLLHTYDERKSRATAGNMENKTFTQNGDMTNASTLNHLVDLFAELEDTISGPRLQNLLQSSWAQDPLMTLKIIFNARSIHLGKSSRVTFYRCAGWLAQNHPATLVANLRWLSRPVIEKKAKKDPEDEDLVFIEEPKNEDDPTRFDVKHGVAHGYWKDLLNILALAANGELTVLSDPGKILNPENPSYFKERSKRKRGEKGAARSRKKPSRVHGSGGTTQEEFLAAVNERTEMGKKEGRESRRTDLERLFNADPVYRGLHLSIARLFSDQLKEDLVALRRDDARARRKISLCGKWAPSHDRFHDRHTLIVSSIAEVLHPRDTFDHVLSPTDTRETYLRYAREEYRKDISALRKHLDVVERKLSAKEIESIKYERLQSKAMQNYAPLFIEKDFDRFEKYLDAVASGKAQISGATLLPSLLVSRQRKRREMPPEELRKLPPAAIVKEKTKALEAKVADGQWNALVKRIKNSGTLSNCIAVADVSGSMGYPVFADETTPMDSSIALSLIMAEVADPPWRGSLITFDYKPTVVKLDGLDTFSEKVQRLVSAPWGYHTNLVAVFEDLILPMALENKLTQDQMVKRVFIFSDMQFDTANGSSSGREEHYTSSLDRIRKAYDRHGYQVPELVFWNLAGGRHSNGGGKPVTVDEVGTSLVSGYSQGMLKVFLDNGNFDEEEEAEEEIVEIVEKDENGELTVREEKREKTIDPLKTAKKAVGHKAYDMLKVVD
ncbi:hypothetical protein NLU13_0978 [Sarocladium strictum]|uniref:Uncharacterized protein n=1 Tax=Sarocladium strictum TaxID=5046 RepID=A0AA39GQ28_SARSR|nr:hypothetical protein NLU13_0978 [Sarocladium strictum]